MLRKWIPSDVLLAAVIAGVTILLAAGTYWIATSTVDRMVRKDAETAAFNWARYLADNLTDIEKIAAGGAPSPASAAFIERARIVGQVFRFKLFDPDGRLALVSDELGKKWDNEPSLAVHNPPAAAVALTGRPHTEVKVGTPPKRPPLYAETYIPVTVDGRVVGIAEVYLDQTAKEALFHGHFALATVALVLLTAVSFGLPAAAFYLRSRQKKRADERILYLAHHDALTGLLNRTSFVDRLDRLVAATIPAGECVAIYYLDLDRFKEVNDTLGHDIGDALIRTVGDRLREAIGPEDVLARLGGDEFVIAQHSADVRAGAEAFAKRLLRIVAAPYTIGGHDIADTASIGIAFAPADGTDSVSLLKCADLALYSAKAAGRNGYRIFDLGMDEQLKIRRSIESAIREAAANDGFDLHFQPLVSASDGRLTGFEALLRLTDREGARLPPDVFVPLAEEMGLISMIGSWVIHRACATAMTWPGELSVSVNLSPAQFANAEIIDVVRSALQRSGLAPERLELEITEGLLLQDTDAVLDQLRCLKTLGVRIAMDDFGTGYSSLSYLWRFPFDKIKVDRSFMQASTGEDAGMPNILRTIIALGHSLNMKVTAEGVETRRQAELLRSLACDYIQGYHFGRPMPEAEISATVLRNFADRMLATAAVPAARRSSGTA
jgi:diguanylate cyclase (GGDEF)-like protein